MQPLLPDIVALHARWLGAKTAIVAPDATLSWRELGEAIERIANGLTEAGCAKGARVGVVMDNSAAMTAIMLGALRAGAIAVPLNTASADGALDAMLDDAGATVVFASPGHAHRISSATLRRCALCVVDSDAAAAPWTPLGPWRAQQSSRPAAISLCRDDVSNIIYSSGTTGQPKGIVHTHGARLDWAHDLAHALRYDSAARTLIVTGLYSNISWASMLCTLLLGGTLVVRAGFDAGDALAAIARHRVSHVSMVPVQYQRLLDSESFAATGVSSMRAMMCCGSALPEGLKQRLFERFPCGIIELYGTTEGAITTLAPEDAPGRLTSVGQPLPGEDITILNDANEPVCAGEQGEIAVLSRFVMNGYWANPAATEAAFWSDGQGRRWLRTGDIGRLDAEGYLYITDRKKDMIVSGGQNVYPADIEAVLLAHEAVSECAVIGIPSERWQETPLALVVVRPGAEIEESALLAWANSRLGKQQRIAALERRAALPRNANGKVLKRELRAAYWPQSAGAPQ